jgi:hypothetical protein
MATTAQEIAIALIWAASSFRLFALSFLESSTPAINAFRGKTTAAATTGPAIGPRPTSSIPAMYLNPCFHNSSSYCLSCLILFFSLLSVSPILLLPNI